MSILWTIIEQGQCQSTRQPSSHVKPSLSPVQHGGLHCGRLAFSYRSSFLTTRSPWAVTTAGNWPCQTILTDGKTGLPEVMKPLGQP